MVTMPHFPATDPHPDKIGRAMPSSLLAAAWMLGAAIALVGVWAIGRQVGALTYVWVMLMNALVVLLAALGALIPATRTAGLLLAWNGLGVSLSLLALGLFSVGALIAMPVILITLGLSAWPRGERETLIGGPAMIVLVGGCLFLPAAYALTQGFGWLARVAG